MLHYFIKQFDKKGVLYINLIQVLLLFCKSTNPKLNNGQRVFNYKKFYVTSRPITFSTVCILFYKWGHKSYNHWNKKRKRLKFSWRICFDGFLSKEKSLACCLTLKLNVRYFVLEIREQLGVWTIISDQLLKNVNTASHDSSKTYIK